MYRWLAQLLGNISVNRKLSLGFGLVLLLTLLITATGWNGLASVIDRGNKLASISTITALTKDLRIARFTYERQPTPDTQREVNNRLGELDAALEVSRKQLVTPEDIVLVQQQLNAVTAYRRAFADMLQGTQNHDQALERMHQQGNVLIDLSQKLSSLQLVKRDQDSQQAKTLLIGCAVLALLIGIMAAWAITRQIVIPLQRTLKSVEYIAAGDLTHNTQTHRSDELGQLQQAIQRMTERLRELVGGISDGITQIASAAEELSAVTEQTSAGVNSQKVETDQVATAMHEMAATVQEVARNAEEAREAAFAADQQAREGDRVVGEAIAQIEQLALEVGHSTEAMGHLKRESDKIGSVLDVIKSVAQQTNLLALNAAIEAARAGEAGRGFAVVADEVRSLAQRTQKSTEEIEELIAGLQSGTLQVSSSMDSSRLLTNNSVELTRRAGESLGNITRTVSTIQGMNQQIAAAAEQQSAVAEEINRSVINVRDVSEQTAAASEETAASSIELARLGTHLQTLVGRFKV